MAPSQKLSIERKNQIHQAALTCFNRKGYHWATMDDIVAESGLSKGTLYWYFSSKRELFVSLLEEAMDQFGIEWAAMINNPQLSATEKLTASLAFFKTEMVKMPPVINILLEAWSLLRHDEEVESYLSEFYKPYVDRMTGIIEEGIASGEFDSDSPSDSAVVIVTLFDGILLAISMGIVREDWDRVIDAAESLVLRGLSAGHTANE